MEGPASPLGGEQRGGELKRWPACLRPPRQRRGQGRPRDGTIDLRLHTARRRPGCRSGLLESLMDQPRCTPVGERPRHADALGRVEGEVESARRHARSSSQTACSSRVILSVSASLSSPPGSRVAVVKGPHALHVRRFRVQGLGRNCCPVRASWTKPNIQKRRSLATWEPDSMPTPVPKPTMPCPMNRPGGVPDSA